MEDLFDITQGKRFTLLGLLPQDPTSENREGALDQQIEKVLQSLDQPQSPGNTPQFARGVTGADPRPSSRDYAKVLYCSDGIRGLSQKSVVAAAENL